WYQAMNQPGQRITPTFGALLQAGCNLVIQPRRRAHPRQWHPVMCPETAEHRDEPPQRDLRIGLSERLRQSGEQASALGDVVEHGFEQALLRLELVIDR